MLPLLPVFILLTTCLIMFISDVVRPRFGYYWLVALVGTILAWAGMFLVAVITPVGLSPSSWRPLSLFDLSIDFLADRIAWSYAFALSTMILAVILTAVVRMTGMNWAAWAESLALTALGMLSVLSGNLFTLILAWAALDLVEIALILRSVSDERGALQAVLAFSGRSLGIMLALAAGIMDRGFSASSTTDTISSVAVALLVIAAGLRLGVLPLHLPIFQEPPLRRGFGTVLRLVPASASLVLLARLAGLETSLPYIAVFLALTFLAGIYAAIAWNSMRDELEGRPMWILGMVTFSLVAVYLGLGEASLSWGVALLSSGSLIYLYSTRGRGLLLLPLSGLWIVSGLPYSPTWNGAQIYHNPTNLLVYLFLFAQSGLMAGYLKHATREGDAMDTAERWVRVFYPIGLMILPVSSLVITWWPWPGKQPFAAGENPWWPGVASLILTGLIWAMSRRLGMVTWKGDAWWTGFLSLGWLYRGLWWLYRGIGKALAVLTALVEGEGGMLWVLLILALLVSLVVQLN